MNRPEPKKGTRAWREIPFECPECGVQPVSVHTEYQEDGWATDGDAVRCDECGTHGRISVAEVDDMWVEWDI